jgi:hypothetical protein
MSPQGVFSLFSIVHTLKDPILRFLLRQQFQYVGSISPQLAQPKE